MSLNIKHLKEPWVLTLIGPPLSGKSTWIKDNFDLNEIFAPSLIIVHSMNGFEFLTTL
jgi:hypothetical protein